MPFRLGPAELTLIFILIGLFPIIGGSVCAYLASRRGQNALMGAVIGATLSLGAALSLFGLELPIIGGIIGIVAGVAIILMMPNRK